MTATDTWITPAQACKKMMSHRHAVTTVINEDNVQVLNEYGVALETHRIFDGSEHELAQPGMVLDWDKNYERQ